jgi:hypothetical protein
MRHAAMSRKGLVPYNKNKVNQDRFVFKYAVGGDPGVSMWGVMDGHGEVRIARRAGVDAIIGAHWQRIRNSAW